MSVLVNSKGDPVVAESSFTLKFSTDDDNGHINYIIRLSVCMCNFALMSTDLWACEPEKMCKELMFQHAGALAGDNVTTANELILNALACNLLVFNDCAFIGRAFYHCSLVKIPLFS